MTTNHTFTTRTNSPLLMEDDDTSCCAAPASSTALPPTENITIATTTITAPKENHFHNVSQCKIKPAFIMEREVVPPPSSSAAMDTSSVSGSGDTSNPHMSGFRKRAKMMKRNQQGDQQSMDAKICVNVRRGVECTFGDKCRFTHDVQAYLAQRPEDLGERCPVLDSKGYCPMGFGCRFVGAHLTAESFRGAGDAEIVARMEKQTLADKNTKEVIKKLHDHTYEFQNIHVREEKRKNVDLRGKVYVAPLTTVGNLPFRRMLVDLQCDVTCGEMALGYQILKGSPSEWALLKRHSSEKLFGVQIAGCNVTDMAKTAELISRECPDVDFIDVNMGCPIEDVTKHGGGSALLNRPARIEQLVAAMLKVAPEVSLGLKMRTGWSDEPKVAHKIIRSLDAHASQLAYVMVHGRSRLQRYTKVANWEYIATECARAAKETNSLQFVGNGDVLSWADYRRATTTRDQGGVMDADAPIATALLGRGALIKPWLCTEIKEQRVWDISATERLDLVKNFANYGMEHWGSDHRGVETTRRYLLEWLSFTHRYVPVGICEEGYIQHMNDRPQRFSGRSDLETLLGSPNSKDWETVAAMFLGPSPEGYQFIPKHKANSW